MIAVDTNIVVYAHRKDSEWHEAALRAMVDLADSGRPWGLPWPCVHEFLAIVTHPKIYQPPSSIDLAVKTIEAWAESPSFVLFHEGAEHLGVLGRLLKKGRVKGPQVHDGRIAALCLSQGVKELWTADRDFSRFGDLKTRNPLV